MFKKTKIIATIGPATENRKIIRQLAEAGMNVARLNFSHGSHQEHKQRIDLAQWAAQKTGRPVAVLQDLSGPKIRLGDFSEESITLKNGKKIILTTKKCLGNENIVFINYKNLPAEIKKNDKILLNDGRNELRVERITEHEIHCRIVVGGQINGRRGVNFPDSYLKISSLTDKDRKDIRFGIKNKVDFMAVSFVRTPENILELKKVLRSANADIKVIAKIETKEAVENLDAIISVSDGVMIARGDLAVEIGAERVPILQKIIIKKCNEIGKPAIVATQMLESMIKNPVPTRAEVNDIANAILDGADAVMLSEETTLGAHPLKAVEVMARVVRHTEENFDYEEILKQRQLVHKEINDSVSYAVANVAHNIGAKAIIALTDRGFTARMVSRYKPKQPIFALTPNPSTYNRLSLSFGCYPLLVPDFKNVPEMSEKIKKIVLKNRHLNLRPGDTIVIAAGVSSGQPRATNFLMVEKI